MKIGIDIREAADPKSGKAIYVFHIVKELLHLDRENEYVLYTDRVTKNLAHFGGAHIKVVHAHPFFWHFAVIRDLKREKVQMFFAAASFIIPAFLPKKIKLIITVHDLAAFLHPALHQFKATVIERIFLRRALKKTDSVLVPSVNTKNDLVRLMNFPAGKIFVTPLGVDEMFFKNNAADNAAAGKKYNLPQKFILAVSGLEPRKNIARLIDAFAEVKKKHTEYKLIIAGGSGWRADKVKRKIARSGDTIMHIGKCETEDLPALYANAAVFVFPSLYEGFGIPPLEAMASGCPAVCSNASSLPEVTGDAALIVNPENTEEIAIAILKIIEDKRLRDKLSERGRARAKSFTWKKTAELTLKSFV